MDQVEAGYLRPRAMSLKMISAETVESDFSPRIKAGRQCRSLEFKSAVTDDRQGLDNRSRSWDPQKVDCKAQIASAHMVLILSPACSPDRVLGAINLLAKIDQVGIEGTCIAGLMPDAWKAYIHGTSLMKPQLPLQIIINTVVRWATECLSLCNIDPMECLDKGRLFKLTTPVIEALNLHALNNGAEHGSLITGQDILNAAKKLTNLPQKGRKSGQKSFWEGSTYQTASCVTAPKDKQETILKSVICLSVGRWVISIKLHSLGTKPAWIGLSDATSSVCKTASNSDTHCMLGTNGLLRMKNSGELSTRILALPFKGKTGELTLKIHLDMHSRTCGFSANGKSLGTVFQNLPKFVRPAISLPPDGVAEFLYMDAS